MNYDLKQSHLKKSFSSPLPINAPPFACEKKYTGNEKKTLLEFNKYKLIENNFLKDN